MPGTTIAKQVLTPSQSAMLLMIPAELHAVVAADYAARWPDFEAPTLAEVGEFLRGR